MFGERLGQSWEKGGRYPRSVALSQVDPLAIVKKRIRQVRPVSGGGVVGSLKVQAQWRGAQPAWLGLMTNGWWREGGKPPTTAKGCNGADKNGLLHLCKGGRSDLAISTTATSRYVGSGATLHLTSVSRGAP